MSLKKSRAIIINKTKMLMALSSNLLVLVEKENQATISGPERIEIAKKIEKTAAEIMVIAKIVMKLAANYLKWYKKADE